MVLFKFTGFGVVCYTAGENCYPISLPLSSLPAGIRLYSRYQYVYLKKKKKSSSFFQLTFLTFLSSDHVTKFWPTRSHHVETPGEFSKRLDVSSIPLPLKPFAPLPSPFIPDWNIDAMFGWTTATLQPQGQMSHLWIPKDMNDCLL